MKYKVGDKVRVRNDLVVGKKYDGITFVQNMSKWLGEIVTITIVDDDDFRYYIEEDKECWIWTDEMFETAERETKYKTGDKVRVREDLHVHKTYGKANFVDGMDRYCGKTVTIHSTCEYPKCYTIEEDGHAWVWADEMLEPALREIRILVNEHTVTATEGKYKGIARCSPEDKFDTVEGVRLAVERLEESKKWPQAGCACFKAEFCGTRGKFKVFSGNVASIDFPAVGKLIFRTKDEAKRMADKLNAVLEAGID